MEELKKYKAKSDGTSIYNHNKNLFKISEQVHEIYNIDSMIDSLNKCIKYHDVGKTLNSFDNSLEGNYMPIRHEVFSASVKELSDIERLAIITHHKQREHLIRYIENEYYEEELNELSSKLDIEFEDVRGFIKKINRHSNKLIKELDAILLKGYLQYCDHLASAGIENIEKGFNAIESFQFNEYNSIQSEVLNMKEKEDILLIAPTGLGKTATSLFFSNLMQNENKSKRIYYLLPYTASITSLFNDMNDREISVSMLHSKAEYFLDKIDSDNRKELYNLFKKSVKQINICTIYQIIKAIFSCKRFEMLLAQLKDSIFIIDEIHCFDTEELSLLLETLKWLKENLNISICVMSASIPSSIQNLIQEKLNINKVIKADKCDFKIRQKVIRKNKYLINDIDNIKKNLTNNQQVLICVNSVKLAQEVYEMLKEYNPKLLHGRFNTKDRQKLEKGLKTNRLLIGTQAIEVSLDISYDVLYTEIAPFDSLQQRFGRVNRRGEKEIGNIFIYDNTDKIYDEDIVNNTDSVISEMIKNDNAIVLEEKTQEYLNKVYIEFDKDIYENTSKKFNSVIKSMKVATFNNSATEDMCSNETVSVLPKILCDEYISLIKDKKYLYARALFVNISKKSLYNKNINFDNEYNIYIADCIYDDRGLVF